MLVKEGQLIKAIELAKIIGITDRHVRNLAKEGIIKKTETGKYLFVESIQGYIQYLESKNEADLNLKDEKIKEEILRIKVDTELKKLRISELKNQLHDAKIVEEVMNNMLINLKGKLLSVANKIAPSVIACDNLGEIQSIIYDAISDTLLELSNYNSDLFKNQKYIEEFEEDELDEIVKGGKNGKNKK